MPLSNNPVEGNHLVIAVPAYDGKVPIQWVNVFVELYRASRQFGFKVSFYYFAHGALITNNRNNAVTEMLEIEDSTHLLFIDSDILFEAKDVVKLLVATSMPEYDLVAGVYPLKLDEPQFQVETFGKVSLPDQTDHGLWEIKAVGTGFMMMKRKVLEQMVKEYPELKYTWKGKTTYALFHQCMEDDRYMGEDISFCKRWRLIGGKLWVDPSIRLKHIGTKIYDHNLIDLMTKEANAIPRYEVKKQEET